MFILDNGIIRIALDENARTTWLENKVTGNGNLITDPKPIYRLNLHTPPNYEDMAFAQDQKCEVVVEGDAIVVRVSEIQSRTGVHPIGLEMRITLDGDHVQYDAVMENKTGSVISELFYPCLGAIRTLDGGPMDLLWPQQLGEKVVNIGAALESMTGRESLHEMTGVYPGILSMCWMALNSGKQNVYFACYDSMLYVTSLRVKGSNGNVSLELDKMCFAKPGEVWKAPRTVARIYAGSWREGADEYRAFAETWRKPIEVKDWMRRMNGYFLVINKQQYGDEMWPYDTIPELYDRAMAHGFDVLGLFGWYHTGHDNTYPDLEVSPTMGGAEGLRKGIDAVHEKGGHVTLYYQGHLMDINSKFYQEKGYKLEGRTAYNNPYYEFYPKACNSDFARNFSRRVFSTVCPSCVEWHELMAQRIDWIASFGADGALYDQIGGMPPYPCFNEAHGHVNNKPSLSYTQGRIKLHTAIRKKVAEHPDFAFMSEHTTDAYSQFLDCVHGISAYPSLRPVNGKSESGVQRKAYGNFITGRMMPELFRYTFPETLGTVRNPKPYMDERLVNYAFVYGCKFEMELRYLIDQQEIRADMYPERRIYAKAVGDLRREFEDYLLLGTFRADEGIRNDDPSLIAMKFVAKDGRKAIAVWNDSDFCRPLKLDMDYKAIKWAGIARRGEGMPAALDSNEVVIIEVE